MRENVPRNFRSAITRDRKTTNPNPTTSRTNFANAPNVIISAAINNNP